MRTFILQALNAITKEPEFEARLDVDHVADLQAHLDIDVGDDPNFHHKYLLDSRDLSIIEQIWGVKFQPEGRDVEISPWHKIREAPYLIHTGFELSLMLEGRKPLAHFAEVLPSDWLAEYMNRFETYSVSGQLIQRIFDEDVEVGSNKTPAILRRVFFCLPGQEWRIEAFQKLISDLKTLGPSQALERLEGELLGYEDWQNDWWIKNGPFKDWPAS